MEISGRNDDVKKQSAELADAVSAARTELFTAIHALTNMLQAIAVRLVPSNCVVSL